MTFVILGGAYLDDELEIFSHKKDIALITNFKINFMVCDRLLASVS